MRKVVDYKEKIILKEGKELTVLSPIYEDMGKGAGRFRFQKRAIHNLFAGSKRVG